MEQTAVRSERLVSLDVFRGLTIIGMILVNNPGSWSYMYWPLGHAPWHGWTPTDWIFPFFLFIVGVAMTFSFDKRLARGANRGDLMAHVVGRAAVLYLLGMILGGFPNFRLITPYILGIAGIEFWLATREHPDSPNLMRNRVLGYVLMVAAAVWFIVDFRYFNGPTQRGSWSNFFPLASNGEGSVIRVVGVLQRIAMVYVVAAAIMMMTRGAWARAAWVVGLIGAYWLIMVYVKAPEGYVLGNGLEGAKADAAADATFRGVLNDWIDVKLLGAHLYSHRPDPEGLLSTIPAVGTTLLGIISGMWLRRTDVPAMRRAMGLLVMGLAMLAVGQLMHYGFPINKKIWSSSYVVFMAGWANLFLGLCYLIIDVKGFKRWTPPVLVFGTNAIVAFFASGLMARMFQLFKWTGADGKELNIKSWSWNIVNGMFADHRNASLAWAITFILLWLLLLTPLYRKRIFIKV